MASDAKTNDAEVKAAEAQAATIEAKRPAGQPGLIKTLKQAGLDNRGEPHAPPCSRVWCKSWQEGQGARGQWKQSRLVATGAKERVATSDGGAGKARTTRPRENSGEARDGCSKWLPLGASSGVCKPAGLGRVG